MHRRLVLIHFILSSTSSSVVVVGKGEVLYKGSSTMLRLTSTRVSLISRRSPRSALTAYRAFSYPSVDAGEDGVPASSSQPQTSYTPTQKHVMDKCKEMHASIMPLNEKVG
jgi:hypothetical protein